MFYKCRSCSGKGVEIGLTCSCKCSTCDGVGFIGSEVPGGLCSFCHGSGRKGFLWLRKCEVCKGIGRGMTRNACGACGGKKRDPNCTKCHGRGVFQCADCAGRGQLDLNEQLATLVIVRNSFFLGDDDPRSHRFEALTELTANQVDSVIAQKHREDLWGGVTIAPIPGRKELRIMFAESSRHDLTIHRVGETTYVIK